MEEYVYFVAKYEDGFTEAVSDPYRIIMKIAIQANPNRGKEIISLLESLGSTKTTLSGDGELYTYYIDDNNVIRYNDAPKDYKVYTLEEFEKEFPFKIGDIVLLKRTNNLYEIVALEWFRNKLCYKLDNGLHYDPKTLTTYKEMKKERNVTLTLDKAKEWYKKGGELKEIALQAFTETELNPLPRSWEEFCERCRIEKDESYINSEGKILSFVTTSKRSWDHICPSKKSAEAHLAMIQLEQLRDCWRQGWIPDYTKTYKKFRIKKLGTEYIVDWSTGLSDFLVFQTEELAKEFLKCFRDLIETAGDLI